MRSLPYPSVIE
jgi:hypothetical protein